MNTKFPIFWLNSQNSLNYIPAKYDTFKETAIETNFMVFSVFFVSNPKKSPIIFNHTVVCSEQNVFFKNESSNTVLMKGSTKTTWKIYHSKIMETLEISVFIIHVKFWSWFNLEGNFYSNMFFFACLFFILLGVWDCFVTDLVKLIKEPDVCPSFCIYLFIFTLLRKITAEECLIYHGLQMRNVSLSNHLQGES